MLHVIPFKHKGPVGLVIHGLRWLQLQPPVHELVEQHLLVAACCAGLPEHDQAVAGHAVLIPHHLERAQALLHPLALRVLQVPSHCWGLHPEQAHLAGEQRVRGGGQGGQAGLVRRWLRWQVQGKGGEETRTRLSKYTVCSMVAAMVGAVGGVG